MLTVDQISQVQRNLAQLRPLAAPTAALFYDKLFERAPGLAVLFRGNMAEQERRLMQMITAAVMQLDDPDRLAPLLHELGARHTGYGVRAEHYAIVGGVLLDTLAAMLGVTFTPPLRRAWGATYGWIATTMQAGAVVPAGRAGHLVTSGPAVAEAPHRPRDPARPLGKRRARCVGGDGDAGDHAGPAVTVTPA